MIIVDKWGHRRRRAASKPGRIGKAGKAVRLYFDSFIYSFRTRQAMIRAYNRALKDLYDAKKEVDRVKFDNFELNVTVRDLYDRISITADKLGKASDLLDALIGGSHESGF